MPVDLDTTNTWLAIMAVASVVQTLLLMGIAAAAWQAVRKASAALEQVEARHLAPLTERVQQVSTRVNQVADDVQEVITRVRRADDAVRAQLGRLDSAAHVAGQAIGSKVWPVVGLSRAVAAAVRAFSSRPSSASATDASRVARLTNP
jgi:ABC-type transporter Mla subunit MlaD